MVDGVNNWLEPEEALKRFGRPESSLLEGVDSKLDSKKLRFGFVLENMGFLIAEKTLSEVVKNAKIYPVPNTQKWMKGLINLRGNLVPVYDLSILLGISSGNQTYENLLVLGKDADSVGVLIDRLPRSFDTTNWQKIASSPLQLPGLDNHIRNTYSVDDIVWMDFDEQGYFKSIKDQVVV